MDSCYKLFIIPTAGMTNNHFNMEGPHADAAIKFQECFDFAPTQT